MLSAETAMLFLHNWSSVNLPSRTLTKLERFCKRKDDPCWINSIKKKKKTQWKKLSSWKNIAQFYGKEAPENQAHNDSWGWLKIQDWTVLIYGRLAMIKLKQSFRSYEANDKV